MDSVEGGNNSTCTRSDNGNGQMLTQYNAENDNVPFPQVDVVPREGLLTRAVDDCFDSVGIFS